MRALPMKCVSLYFIENPYRPVTFDYLMVSPTKTHGSPYEMIDREIAANTQQALTVRILKPTTRLIKGWSTGYTRRVGFGRPCVNLPYAVACVLYSATGRH
ncbi:hypothetical protein KCP74_12665 [Salmonella enterica subsp. enterica]|nr:hypothetical protein KCP74_12665 [Salmonella enterica subsp. enterica]